AAGQLDQLQPRRVVTGRVERAVAAVPRAPGRPVAVAGPVPVPVAGPTGRRGGCGPGGERREGSGQGEAGADPEGALQERSRMDGAVGVRHVGPPIAALDEALRTVGSRPERTSTAGRPAGETSVATWSGHGIAAGRRTGTSKARRSTSPPPGGAERATFPRMTATDALTIDVLDPHCWVDLDRVHEVFARARLEAPVFRDVNGYWVVTRHADVVDVE